MPRHLHHRSLTSIIDPLTSTSTPVSPPHLISTRPPQPAAALTRRHDHIPLLWTSLFPFHHSHQIHLLPPPHATTTQIRPYLATINATSSTTSKPTLAQFRPRATIWSILLSPPTSHAKAVDHPRPPRASTLDHPSPLPDPPPILSYPRFSCCPNPIGRTSPLPSPSLACHYC